MAIEEEFGIEIPDAEADEITTVAQGEFLFPSSVLTVIGHAAATASYI